MKLADYIKQEKAKLSDFESMVEAETKHIRAKKAFLKADRAQDLKKFPKKAKKR